jgi:alpha-N-arabinofuranosidase
VEPGTNPAFLYQQNTLRDALVAGLTLNIFNNHCDRVRMANIAQLVNVLQALILTDGAAMVTTPTYHIFDLYKPHQNAALLPCVLESDLYDVDGQQIPQISVSASRDGSRRIHLTLCNVDPRREADVRCELRGVTPQEVMGSVLTANDMRAHNTFQDPGPVVPVPFDAVSFNWERLAVTLPPMSVVALRAGR